MKKKALVLASCVAFATPTISIAKALPENLAGLNLGDITTSSYLNQPFRGVIPFLFTRVEDAQKLSVRLAPRSVFEQIGAEKLHILNDLTFQITTQSNKPAILISSHKPVQLPFLNFVLEIEGPQGVLYQDFTVLLDPQGHNHKITDIQDQPKLFEMTDQKIAAFVSNPAKNISNLPNVSFDSDVSKIDLPITYSSNSLVTNQANQHKIKAGDSLSRISRWYKPKEISLEKMMQAIFNKNPQAFIRGDIDRIKRGVVINLPTHKELHGLNNIANQVEFINSSPKAINSSEIKNQYTVVKGDSLSKITTLFVEKDTSFTKMMKAIFTANPDAFVSNNMSKLKAGAILQIPTFKNVALKTANSSVETQQARSATITPEPSQSVKTDNNKEHSSAANKISLESSIPASLKANEYKVKVGDTLTKITKELGYKDVSFTKMMKAIYAENIHAFEKNNITRLIPGAVLAIPKISTIKSADSISAKKNETKTESTSTVSLVNSKKNSIADLKSSVATSKLQVNKATISTKTNNTSSKLTGTHTVKLDTANLEKRIRELRAELDQAKSGLTEMKDTLRNKDALISEKDEQLVNLKSALIKIKVNRIPEETVAKVPESAPEEMIEEMNEENELYLENHTSTPSQLAALKMLKKLSNSSNENNQQDGFNHMVSSAVKKYYDNTSPKSLAYLSMALILGWLLIRYRREIYSYTAINFDQPKYYPAPDVDEYELKERNITYHDPIEDKTVNTNLESNKSISKKLESEIHQEQAEEFGQDSNSIKEDTVLLDEASKEIDQLVTELFTDLNPNGSSSSEAPISDNEWSNIEKICADNDETIEENLKQPLVISEDHAENNIQTIQTEDKNAVIATCLEDDVLTNNQTETSGADFDELMSDLMKSLDDVEKSINKNANLARNKKSSIPDNEHPIA